MIFRIKKHIRFIQQPEKVCSLHTKLGLSLVDVVAGEEKNGATQWTNLSNKLMKQRSSNEEVEPTAHGKQNEEGKIMAKKLRYKFK